MHKRNWTLFAVLAALAALAALSVGSAGSAVAAGGSASASAASGENATAAHRRRGRRGPRGRRGRRGPTGATGPGGAAGPPGIAGATGTGQTSSGLARVFFAANGTTASTTLINVNNMNLQTDCVGADQDPEFRTLINDAWFAYTDDDEYQDQPELDIGEVFDSGDGLDEDDELYRFNYSNEIGQVVAGTLHTEDGTADQLFGSVDCALIGYYTAL